MRGRLVDTVLADATLRELEFIRQKLGFGDLLVNIASPDGKNLVLRVEQDASLLHVRQLVAKTLGRHVDTFALYVPGSEHPLQDRAANDDCATPARTPTSKRLFMDADDAGDYLVGLRDVFAFAAALAASSPRYGASGGGLLTHNRLFVVPDNHNEQAALGALFVLAAPGGSGTDWDDLGCVKMADSGWMTEAPLSQWYGVSMRTTRHVVMLELSACGLGGALPASLCNLQCPKWLDLSRNKLHSGIPPELGKLVSLEYHKNLLSSSTRTCYPACRRPSWPTWSGSST
jgi:hypothetical protein